MNRGCRAQLGRSLRRVVCAGLLALALSVVAPRAAFAAGSAPASASRADVVVVLLTPFLAWDDVSPSATPNLWALAADGAVANMNSVTADEGWPTVAGGALTLSAGVWAAASPDPLPASKPFATLRAENARLLSQADVGALGGALHAAGLVTAAIGCDDLGVDGASWPAATLAIADRSGKVDFASTAADLLSDDGSSAYRVRADAARISEAVAQALALIDSSPAGKGVLVVEPGDLVRAHHAESGVPGALHARAVENTDRIAGQLRQVLLGKQVLFLAVTPTTDKAYYQAPFFGPTIAYGLDLHGFLTSGSTHRSGLVSNGDFGPTVLAALGVQKPSSMVGSAFAESGVGSGVATSVADRVSALVSAGQGAGSVDYLRDLTFTRWFCLLGSAVALLAAAVACVRRPAPWLRKPLGALLLLALSVPPAAWLMFVLGRYPRTPALAAAHLGAAAAGVFAVAVLIWAFRRRTAELPLVFLSALTAFVVCADQWFGHPVESGLFSYSIRAGWRYYGMGNEGAGLAVAASIAAVGMLCDLADKTRRGRIVRLWTLPVVGVVVLVSAAAPFAGANAGVAVWGPIAYAVAWFAVNGLRITWRRTLAIAVGVVVLVGVFVAIDLSGIAGETHLGRFFSGIATGGLPAVWELVHRKLVNAVDYISQTPYTGLAAAIVVALVIARWSLARPLARALEGRRRYAGALLGVVVGSAVALVTEDSSIIMPALMLFAGALPALYLALTPSSDVPRAT